MTHPRLPSLLAGRPTPGTREHLGWCATCQAELHRLMLLEALRIDPWHERALQGLGVLLAGVEFVADALRVAWRNWRNHG